MADATPRRPGGLLLTRRAGESIMIGDEIEISLLSVSGDTVRIGVDAPIQVKVLRAELFEDTNASASSSVGNTSSTASSAVASSTSST